MFSTEKSESEFIMDFLVKLAPMIQELVPIDCMISVADMKNLICSLPGKSVKLSKDMTGVEMSENLPISKAIKSGKPERVTVPKEVAGITFDTTSIPIFDSQGKIIGGMGLGIALENREILIDTSNLVATSSEQASVTIEELATSAEQLADEQSELLDLSQEITEQISETKKIIEIVRGVAHTSNILGLNASIEAARAGEQGKGFSVVAGEIRKMAENSSSAIKDVENILNNIKDKVEMIDRKINEISNIGHNQAAATEEISKNMEELAESASKLKQASSLVLG